jgi:hypothetical protein
LSKRLPQVPPFRSQPRSSKLKDGSGPPVFAKFADVKSRINWMAERRQQLQARWERGDKASTMAAALGCSVGAINVARPRLDLKPRRIVSGRPKQEPDDPAHKIERVALTTSRLMEFCTQNELVSSDWPRVLRVVALHLPSPPMAPKRPSMSSARGRHR